MTRYRTRARPSKVKSVKLRGVCVSPKAKIGKLGLDGNTELCAATYAPFVTCPDSCPFKDGNGCYAANAPCVFTAGRITREAIEDNMSLVEIALAEAKGIDGLPGDRPLRLHVSGDCKTDETARIVAAASERYMDRSGEPVWGYTHAWQDVARESWGRVSMFASCETLEEAREAMAEGYAVTMVRDGDAMERCGDISVVACKHQRYENRHKATGSGEYMPCFDCRMCMKDGLFARKGIAIKFAPHGVKRQNAIAAVAAKN